MSDHNSKTPGPIYLKFWFVNSVESHGNVCSFGFEILSWVGQLLPGKIAKIVISDQVRVNGWSNYE